MADKKKEHVPTKKRLTDIQTILPPKVGQMTFMAEGMEGTQFASRYPHVPSGTSGLTLGRGYDLSKKSGTQIKRELIQAGVVKEDAEIFAKAHKKTGELAKKFITDNKLEDFSITPAQQLKLFQTSYKEVEADVKRICQKKLTEETYGKCNWNKMNASIKEMLIDLRYRGDYIPETRKFLQKHVAENNLEEFKKVMLNKDNWKHVPADRFKRRSDFIKAAK